MKILASLSAIVAVAAFVVGLGEFAWIGICIGVPFCFLRRRRTGAASVAIGGVSLVVLVLHFFGFKVYGSSMIFENDPMMDPVGVAGVEFPDTLLLSSGRHVPLAGHGLVASCSNVPPSQLMAMLFRQNKDVVVDITEADGQETVFLKHRIQYWCGNTFFPQPFPERLPRYRRVALHRIHSFLMSR